MKSAFFRNRNVWIALLLSTTGVLGFLLGGSRGDDSAAREGTQLVSPNLSRSNISKPISVAALPTSNALPLDLKTLNGRELVAAIPRLEKIARDGDAEATRILYRRLGACVDFQKQSDAEIHERESERCQQQIGVAAQIRGQNAEYQSDPRFNENTVRQNCELWLKQALDERDLCTTLTPQQIDSHLDWLQLALQRHDHEAVLEVVGPNGLIVRSIERVRTAEKLVEIAQVEQGELENLIAAGDASILQRAMVAYTGDSYGMLPRDPESAYAYAYALSLADATEDTRRSSAWMMEKLSKGPWDHPLLTAQQIEAARARGRAFFQRCCAKR